MPDLQREEEIQLMIISQLCFF